RRGTIASGLRIIGPHSRHVAPDSGGILERIGAPGRLSRRWLQFPRETRRSKPPCQAGQFKSSETAVGAAHESELLWRAQCYLSDAVAKQRRNVVEPLLFSRVSWDQLPVIHDVPELLELSGMGEPFLSDLPVVIDQVRAVFDLCVQFRWRLVGREAQRKEAAQQIIRAR